EQPQAVARPLKVLAPLIQRALADEAAACLPYYIAAGEALLEAKTQLSYGAWGRWLSQHFALTRMTAWRYMRAAERARESTCNTSDRTASLLELLGETERRRTRRATHRRTWAAYGDVDAEAVAQARQSRADEIRLHRDLALELLDIGYKARATRLHPDRG